MPTMRDAVRAVFDQIKKIGGFSAGDMPARGTGAIFRGFAERVRLMDPVLALAFDLIALSPDDDAAATANIVAGANGLLCSADGDTAEARARMRVWEDVARRKYDPVAYGGGFFEIADKHWRGEMRFIVAANPHGATMRDRYSHPALQLLIQPRWDWAFGSLQPPTRDIVGDDSMARLIDAVMRDRASAQAGVEAIVEDLYAVGTPSAGALALAWQMLTADPRKPQSFSMLPQVQFAIDHADLEADDDAELRARIRIWWRAAEGEWTESEVSIFRIADVGPRPGVDDMPDPEPEVHPQEMTGRTSTSATLFADLGLPTLVVMPKDRSSKLNNFHSQYRDLVDAALPLVVVRDVAGIRRQLHAEFPHATTAIDLLLRDLREGRPFWLKPLIILGPPGVGKSRVVRRLAQGASRRLYVYRFEASSSADSHFGGTSKAWSNTEPSVPARAVAQGKIANPVVLIDEIDKSSTSQHQGRLVDALLPFCDRETAGRYRDQSLDSEIDLSMVSCVACANDVSKLPSPLRDRMRIIRVPAPTLQHLSSLAAQVMRDLAIEDEARAHDEPLAPDELAIIEKAWAKAGFSMRKLQAIVGATLEARDQYAMRH
jgi:hypothetical protein